MVDDDPEKTGPDELGAKSPEERARVLRIYSLTVNLFHGDRGEALRWLNSPAYAFRGMAPLEHAKTVQGAEEVELLIGRMKHGIPT